MAVIRTNLGVVHSSSTGGPVSISPSHAVPVGTVLVVTVGANIGTTGSTVGVTDSKGNQYDYIVSEGSNRFINLFVARIRTALTTGDTITATPTPTGSVQVIVLDSYAGIQIARTPYSTSSGGGNSNQVTLAPPVARNGHLVLSSGGEYGGATSINSVTPASLEANLFISNGDYSVGTTFTVAGAGMSTISWTGRGGVGVVAAVYAPNRGGRMMS